MPDPALAATETGTFTFSNRSTWLQRNSRGGVLSASSGSSGLSTSQTGSFQLTDNSQTKSQYGATGTYLYDNGEGSTSLQTFGRSTLGDVHANISANGTFGMGQSPSGPTGSRTTYLTLDLGDTVSSFSSGGGTFGQTGPASHDGRVYSTEHTESGFSYESHGTNSESATSISGGAEFTLMQNDLQQGLYLSVGSFSSEVGDAHGDFLILRQMLRSNGLVDEGTSHVGGKVVRTQDSFTHDQLIFDQELEARLTFTPEGTFSNNFSHNYSYSIHEEGHNYFTDHSLSKKKETEWEMWSKQNLDVLPNGIYSQSQNAI